MLLAAFAPCLLGAQSTVPNMSHDLVTYGIAAYQDPSAFNTNRAGAGEVPILLTVNGQIANAVTMSLK